LNKTNLTPIVKEKINNCLDQGMTRKQEIFSKVVEELGIPRPAVRRIARELRNEMLEKVHVLQSDVKVV